MKAANSILRPTVSYSSDKDHSANNNEKERRKYPLICHLHDHWRLRDKNIKRFKLKGKADVQQQIPELSVAWTFKKT